MVWALALVAGQPARVGAQEPLTLVVDWPSDGGAVPSSVTLSGWAVAPGSMSGTGLDAVRAYLDGPADAGIALGSGNYGLTRPDVALALRDGRFAPSGWQLNASLPSGSHALFVYAHQADRPGDDGWLGPVELMVRVEGGSSVGALTTTERAAAPAAASAGCGGRDVGTGPCSAGSSAPGACAVPDRDSSRCLLRNPSATSSTTVRGPVAIVPGSWSAVDPASAAPSANGAPATSSVPGRIGYPAAPLMAVANSPATTTTTASQPSAPVSATQSGMTVATSQTGMLAPTSQSSAERAAADSAGAALSGASAGGASASGARPGSTTLSLTASQMGTREFQLSWNQLGPGISANYEVRRCSSLVSAPSTCELVATVQAGAYRLVQPEGFYYVRALGPGGQAAGESNRVQLCCRS